MKPKLLIASNNPGKHREMRALLASLNIEVLSPQDAQAKLNVHETGTSYSENARLKAMAYLAATGLPTLADDSGLEVDILNGAPGIHSARFSAKENASDANRRAHLLAQLRDKPQPWNAHFHCTAILALSENESIETTGRCDGLIIPDERGTGGFGYDPVFYLPEFQATMAELLPEIKNQISHRAKAIRAMLPLIQSKLIAN